MEMIQVLNRIRDYRRNYPDKYGRICRRLDQLLENRVLNSTEQPGTFGGATSGQKDSDEVDTLEKLILLDEENRKYWTSVNRARKNPKTENHYKDNEHHMKKEKTLDFSLARTLFSSDDPDALFTRMCLYNSPSKVVANMTRNSNRREFLYNLRTKYDLPMPDFLHVKTEQKLDNLKTYQQNRESLKGLHAVLLEPVIVAQDDNDGEESAPALQTDQRPSATDILLDDPGHPDDIVTLVERRPSLIERVMSSISVTPEEVEEAMRRSLDPNQRRTPGEVESDDVVVAAAKERLRKLYLVFQESDTDDEPGLNIDEFKVAMRRIGGEEMTDREIELTFMKVDANCDGNVDWTEFLEFTLREFQERDIMTQLTRDLFCDGLPNLLHQGLRQIQALVWVSATAAHSSKSVDHHTGRYYSVTMEGLVKCWTTDFKQAGSNDFILIPNFKQATCFERVNDVICMPEIRALVVAFSTSVIRFYYTDDTKLEEFCMIYGLASPANCFSYVFREDISILSFGDHSGKVQALRFKNLFYDGFWTGMGIGQPANNQVSWATLKKLDKSIQIEATKKVGFINQIKYVPDLNLILTCTSDPTYSLNFIPIGPDRPCLHISNPEGGFECFEYHHEMHLIATGGKDHTLRIWQPDRLDRPAIQFHNHGGSVDKVHLVKDHKFQVAISVDARRTIRIFDLKEQALHLEFHCPINGVERGRSGFLHYNRATGQIFYGGTEILMVHRRSPKNFHHHENHIVTHKQPVVAALHNDLFDCIVSGGQDSSIIVWNCVDGEKIIQFFNAHTVMDHGKTVAVPIRRMTFDSSRRRLLTVGEDNLIKIWNFNNGACLTKYEQLKTTVITDIGYHKNRDLVMAAGFNASVYMVRDTRGVDEVDETEYRWERLHRSDIVTFEVRYPIDVVEATESEKIAQAIRPTPSTKSTRSNFSHHPSTHLPEEPSEHSSASEVDGKLLDDGSVLFSASYDGEIIQWNLFTGRPICSFNTDLCPEVLSPAQRAEHISPCTFDMPHVNPKDSGNLEAFFGVQQKTHKKHRRVTSVRDDNTDNKEPNFKIHPVPPPTKDAVTCMVLLNKRARDDANVATLLTTSADGFIRGWSTCLLGGGGLKGLFFAGHAIGSYVLHACTDDYNEVLFTADSLGYVKVWFICEWADKEKAFGHRHEFDPRCFPALRRYKLFGPALARHATRIMGLAVPLLDKRHQPFYNAPLVLNSFRAHTSAINHISIVQKRDVIITASRDCAVRLWTFSGLYIATLGQHEAYHVDLEKLHMRNLKLREEEWDRGEVHNEEPADELPQEEDSDDETFLKPRVVVPPDIRQQGSLMTLNVVRNLKFRSWEEACRENCETKAEIKEKEEQILVPSEFTHLDVRNHYNPDFRYDKFLFLGYVSPIEYTYGDAEVYTNIAPQPMQHYHNIEEVLPNCVLDYNIEKVQTDWIARLPKWQRPEFRQLQKEGNLYGNSLRQLIALVRKEQRRKESQEPSSTNQSQSGNQEVLKLEAEEQRVIDALQRVGAEARPTLVNFLLEPPRKDFLTGMLCQDAHQEPNIQTKTPDEAFYNAMYEERARQVKPFVPVVARNMHLLTELQVLGKQASLSKRPARPPQMLLRPSCTLIDAVQHIHRIGRVPKQHPLHNRIFDSPKVFSRRKQPKVPSAQISYPITLVKPEELDVTDPSPLSEGADELSPVSSDCSIKSDVAGDTEHIWMEMDDKHKEPFSVAEAWHAHMLNPHIALPTSHRAPVTVGKAMKRFLRKKPLLKDNRRFW